MDAVIASIGTWILGKVADKGFESVSDSLKPDKINKQISGAINKVSKKLQVKYPNVSSDSISYFFHKEEVLEEVVKLTFKDARVDVGIIESIFDTSTLPSGYIVEFIDELKNEMLKNRELNNLLSNSEIYVAITGLKKDVESLANNSNLSKKKPG